MNDELVDIEAVLVYQTVDAWRVELVPPGRKSAITVWLPKSRCERTGQGAWRVPMWLADKEGLI